jgi:hypothetical protein
MDFRETVTRVNGAVNRMSDALGFLAPLATRIVLGLAFFQAGTGKFRNFDNVIGFFDSLGIPFPAFNAGGGVGLAPQPGRQPEQLWRQGRLWWKVGIRGRELGAPRL